MCNLSLSDLSPFLSVCDLYLSVCMCLSLRTRVFLCVCMYVCVRETVRVCMCVCVCVREREITHTQRKITHRERERSHRDLSPICRILLCHLFYPDLFIFLPFHDITLAIFSPSFSVILYRLSSFYVQIFLSS